MGQPLRPGPPALRGWLRVPQRRRARLSTLYLDRPPGASTERRFGIGYYQRLLRADGVAVREDVYAPFGNDPVLLHDVTIRNTTRHAERVSWFEYWDVNPYNQTLAKPRGLGVPRWNAAPANPHGRPGAGRRRHASAEHLRRVAARTARRSRDLGRRVLRQRRPRLAGRGAPGSPPRHDRAGVAEGTPGRTLFAFRAPLHLRAGQSVTLRYVYGMAHPGTDPGARPPRTGAAANPFVASERAWRAWLPKASFGPRWRWVARELQWDAYLLRAASVYEEVCGHHTITQGGYYQYASGLNLGSRSWLHYLLPMVYADPSMAREILRYTVSLQSSNANDIPYGTGPLCTLYNALGTSDDLDFWLLLASAEYGLGSRDVAFFSEKLPLYGSHRRSASGSTSRSHSAIRSRCAVRTAVTWPGPTATGRTSRPRSCT